MTNSHFSSPSGRPLVPPDLFRLANEHLSLAIFDDKELMAMVALFDDHLSIFPQERWDLEKTRRNGDFINTRCSPWWVLSITLLSLGDPQHDILSDIYSDILSGILSKLAQVS